MIQLPIYNADGKVIFEGGASSGNYALHLTNPRAGFGTYNLRSDGASAQVDVKAFSDVTVTDPIEIDTGSIDFESDKDKMNNTTDHLTGGLNLYGGNMVVGSANNGTYVTLDVDNFTIGSAGLTIYIGHTTGTGSTIAVSGTLTVGRAGQGDLPTMDVLVQDGSNPDTGGSWDVMTYGARVKNSGWADGDIKLDSWAGFGHDFTTKYTVSD